MAPRRNPVIDAKHRERIQTTQLLKRLHVNALTEECMTQGQLKSAEILLRKSLPDLQAVTLSGDASNPISIQTITRKIVRPGNRDG